MQYKKQTLGELANELNVSWNTLNRFLESKGYKGLRFSSEVLDGQYYQLKKNNNFSKFISEEKEIAQNKNLLKIETEDEVHIFFEKLKNYLEKESVLFRKNHFSNFRIGKYQKLEIPISSEEQNIVYYIHFDSEEKNMTFGIWDYSESVKFKEKKIIWKKNTHQSGYCYKGVAKSPHIEIDEKSCPQLLKGMTEYISKTRVFPEIKEIIENIYNDFNENLKKINEQAPSNTFSNINNIDFTYKLINFIKKNKTKDIFKEEKNILDCCVKQIKIESYQGIKNIHISNIPIDAQWIFLTGENGFGKTSILQAIVIALFGNKDNGKDLDKKEEIKYLLEYKYDQNRINSNKNKEHENFFSQCKNFAAYGASRLNKSKDEMPQTYSLFNSDGTLLDIEGNLSLWYNKKDAHYLYENVTKILIELLSPYIDEIKVNEKDEWNYEIIYHEKNTKEDDWKSFNELASGYKSIIATFGDMILRLRKHQPDVKNAKDLNGIVIIDEFDLHLHPKWQKALVEKLTNTFPKIQFIVSTHSPIPLLGSPPEQTIIINVNRTKEEGITARRLKKLEKELKYLSPNQLLTSDIFGFEEIENSYLKDEEFDNIHTENNYNDIEKNEKLHKELEELANNQDFFPEKFI